MPRAFGPSRAWLAFALLQLLGGCLGAVALPLLAGGGLMATTKHRVRAATQVAVSPATTAGATTEEALLSSKPVLTTLTELPPPSGASGTAVDDSWQAFFRYAQTRRSAKDKNTESALLKQPPSLDAPARQKCAAPVAAVVIDLDDGRQAFAPETLTTSPTEVAAGLASLRQAGLVVLWISRLPAGRAAEVAQALRAAGLDPQGEDQLLLLRNPNDRKQLLRQDASKDVCVVAIAGDDRGDFDELFDYLRNPGSAAGLFPMMGQGWFLVPSLIGGANRSTER